MPKVKAKKTKAPKGQKWQIKASTQEASKRHKKLASKPKKVTHSLSVPVFDITGKSQGTVSLPNDIFGVEPNKKLLTQATRVYFANQLSHKGSTKTRAEVRGGGAKPWRQKGTGRARAGSIRSPLWVGGGVIFGPKPRHVKLTLPRKMRLKALISALSQKRLDGTIKVINNFDRMEPKTKIASNLFKKLSVSGQTLVVLEGSMKNVRLAIRNIPKTAIETAENLNAYQVLANRHLLLSKGAIDKFKV